LTTSPDTIEPYLLTVREWQCAHLYVQGLNNAEIARQLKCSAGLVASMLERPGVRAHITVCANELAHKERMTEEWLYAQAKAVIESPLTTGAEKVAAMRLVSRWRGMEIERIEITEHGSIDELEKARRRAIARDDSHSPNGDLADCADAVQNASPTRPH
jgi:hypothetical protein